jgi:lysozyme
MPSIEEQLMLHEGLKLKAYLCPAGKTTVGVGRNLEDRGITRDEALFLLRNDIKEITEELSKRYSWFSSLDFVRQKVLIDMTFNIGLGGLSQFRNMLNAIEGGDYQRASTEMENSRWYRQVGIRAKRLTKMMRTGSDY